jgi:hypothetical protein
VLKELCSHRGSDTDRQGFHLITEDETLGTIMEDVRDPSWASRPTFGALIAALVRIENLTARDDRCPILVERFHLTTYALHPHWDELRDFDSRLTAWGAIQVVLCLPESEIPGRSIFRRDRENWGSEMADWYGSEEAAVEAAKESQRRRIHALSLTQIPSIQIDTTDRDWHRYAAAIAAFLASHNASP